MQEEIWKDIPNYEGIYQASDQGRVRSLDKIVHEKNGRLRFMVGRILKPRLREGYQVCGLRNSGGRRVYDVHKLVAMAFLNHTPNGYNIVVDHINNIRTDNRLENLQLVSQRYNTSKDLKAGTSKYTGVNWDRKKWRAGIRINGKSVHLGYFSDESEAAVAYQKALAKLENEKNKPTEQQ